MVKKIFFLFCFYSLNIHSQTFPSVTCSTGKFFNNFVYYNLGEPQTITLSQPFLVLTQGFIQPPDNNIVLALSDNKENSFEVISFPNPFNDHISLQIKNAGAENISIEMLDVLGRIIPVSFQIDRTNSNVDEYSVNTSSVSSGTYFIRVLLQPQTLKIIKIIKL
jgi:hypothetical protein